MGWASTLLPEQNAPTITGARTPLNPWAPSPIIRDASDMVRFPRQPPAVDYDPLGPGSPWMRAAELEALSPFRPAGGAPRSFDANWWQQVTGGLAPTPSSLAGLESQLNAWGVKVLRNAAGIPGKIQLPDGRIVDVGRSFSSGNPGAMGWQWMEGGGGPGGGFDLSGLAGVLGSSFSDPDTVRLLEFINGRLGELTSPLPTGSFGQFQSAAQALAGRLQQPFQNPYTNETVQTLQRILGEVSGDPFTSAQWAALRAESGDELTRSRDQDVRTTLARMAALGHGKGSGTIAEAVRDVESGYQANRAAGERQLQIAAIEQANRNRQTASQVSQQLRQIPLEEQQFADTRATQAIGMLNAIVQAEAQRRGEEQQRLTTATTLMGIPVQLADQRLQQALAVLGMGGQTDPLSILQVLGGLSNQANANSMTSQQNNAGLWAWLGQFLGGLGGG